MEALESLQLYAFNCLEWLMLPVGTMDYFNFYDNISRGYTFIHKEIWNPE